MTNNQKVKKEELEQVINALTCAFQAENEKKHYDMCANYLKEYGATLLNPEHYELFVSFELENFHRVLILNLLNTEQVTNHQSYNDKQEDSLLFLYEHYQFIDSHLDRVVEKYEGFACSADKTRYVLRLYREYIITGEMPVFKERNNYWIPNFGSSENWIHFVETLKGLYYGLIDEHITARQRLVEEIEVELERRKKQQNEYFLLHPNFVYTTQVENENGTVYHFVGEAEGEKLLLQLQILDKGNNGYILKQGDKRLRYGDKKPVWAEELIEKL